MRLCVGALSILGIVLAAWSIQARDLRDPVMGEAWSKEAAGDDAVAVALTDHEISRLGSFIWRDGESTGFVELRDGTTRTIGRHELFPADTAEVLSVLRDHGTVRVLMRLFDDVSGMRKTQFKYYFDAGGRLLRFDRWFLQFDATCEPAPPPQSGVQEESHTYFSSDNKVMARTYRTTDGENASLSGRCSLDPGPPYVISPDWQSIRKALKLPLINP